LLLNATDPSVFNLCSGEAPSNEIRVAATQSLSTIIERALEAFKTHDTVVVRGLGGAISGAVQVQLVVHVHCCAIVSRNESCSHFVQIPCWCMW
jgi:hypothetical protein